jgi:hypothetical protein
MEHPTTVFREILQTPPKLYSVRVLIMVIVIFTSYAKSFCAGNSRLVVKSPTKLYTLNDVFELTVYVIAGGKPVATDDDDTKLLP